MSSPSLRDQYAIWLGRPLAAGDACAVQRIDDAQARLGVAAPEPLRALYECVGASPMLMRSFQRFLPPEDWRVEAGRLVFLEENQGVCEWGVDAQQQVWMRLDPGPQWHAEGLDLQGFLDVVLPYQLAQGGWPFAGMCTVPRGTYAAELAALARQLGWPLVTDHNGLTLYGQGACLLWALAPARDEDEAMLFLSCLHQDEFGRLLAQLDFAEL